VAQGAHPDWSNPLAEDWSKPPPEEGLGLAVSVVCGFGLATGRGAGVGVGVGAGVVCTGVTGAGVVTGAGADVTVVCGAGAATADFARARCRGACRTTGATGPGANSDERTRSAGAGVSESPTGVALSAAGACAAGDAAEGLCFIPATMA
jgi:hypothetical protein